jgi:signal transduction histidine kinase/ligand-binding sensor domain-containing protein
MRIFLFIIFFFSVTSCYGQDAGANIPLVLSNISEQNGLSDDHVKCVLKDKDNFIWIGTSDGLNLVDGSTIKIFRHKEGDSTSLPASNIITITEDSLNDLLYIGTMNGLCWYDKNKKTFTSAFPPQSPYGSTLDIESVILAANNKIWCATDGGLFLFDTKEKKFIAYYNNSVEQGTEPKYSNKLTYMTTGNNDILWICSGDGLWSFDTKSKTFKKIIHKNNDLNYHPLCLYAYVDHEQNIWAGFWNTGLKKYDTHAGRLIGLERSVRNNQTVSCINEIKQPDGNYLIWVDGNLLAFDERENAYFNFHQPLSEKKLPPLSPLYQSADGWVWLGSDNGLYIYNPQRQLFNHHLFKSSITSQGVSFYNYKNGLLVGAGDSNFLKWKDKNGNVLKDYSPPGNGTTLHSIQQDKPDDFWLGTGKGILHTNLVTGERSWFMHKDGDSTTVPRDFITCLLIDSKENLWVFPWREGIWQMDKQTGKCKRLLEGFIPEVNRTKRLVVNDAAEDANGNIWMADLDEGIIFYNTKTKRFSKPFEKQLGSRYETSRIFFKNRMAYSVVGDGLLRWNIDSAVVQKIALPGEMNKGLTDMYPDKSGNWWMTSRNGLIVFNEKENVFNRFTKADGLIQNDINGTIFCAEDGTMLIGTPTYFTSFNPELLTPSSISKKNVITTEILANNKAIDWNKNNKTSLSYRENNIIVRWALPDYNNPFRNQYYVKLNGIDDDWRYVGNTGEVQYANLSPGDYTIQLKAATANGVSSQNTIDLKFVIHPPFWKTWWFITFISLALVTSFIVVVRYISQRNLKEKLLRLEKEQAIEKERNRISRDMHDDLGSGLTKIAIMSEVVKKQLHEPEKAKQQLENISESSRELVDNLQDIIWVLNPKNDTLESLAAYIREYALKFFEPFETGINFNYPETFGDIKLSEETRRNFFLVIKESFNNIAKHAWCNNVTITINQTSSSVQVQLKDDGKGFAMEKTRQFGNGLVNMKNRIEQIGGVYKIDSEMGKGTETIVEIVI